MMYIALCIVHQGTPNDVYKALQAQEKEQWCRQQTNIYNYKNIFQNAFEIEAAAKTRAGTLISQIKTAGFFK